MSYIRFGAMIATSTVVMFGLMYLNTFAWEHVLFSETRAYMAVLMGATMAIIMLAFMLGMYPSTRTNAAILMGAAVVFALMLWLVRSQATVGQVSYMRAMIPHHSIAIMTSERATITDPRVRKLADEIAEAQRREIAEMRYLIAALERDGPQPPTPPEPAAPGEPVPLAEALGTVVAARLDPEPLTATEADAVLEPGPGCAFARTEDGAPILVARAGPQAGGPAQGLMKLQGKLVLLRAESGGGVEALRRGGRMSAGGVVMAVMPEGAADDDPRQADLVFELEQGLTVGYRGVYRC